jgi:hypothetical protein
LSIKKTISILFICFNTFLYGQKLTPFIENGKWGYKKNGEIVISAQYDTVFRFDRTRCIALVANKNTFNKEVNPITGVEQYAYDYHYINANNQKIKLLAEHFPDSMSSFPQQQELHLNYQDSSNYFKILFQDKIYLFTKTGKQLSSGFDNITETNAKGYFETENNTEFEKQLLRIKGLVDSTGLEVVKCKYNHITINQEDSSIYCCSAVYNNKLNDDVYDYKGNIIFTHPKHIAFSSKTLHVMKSYIPREEYIIEDAIAGESHTLDGTNFSYLKNNKALLINKNNWYLLDLITRKKQKVDKEEYFTNLFIIS